MSDIYEYFKKISVQNKIGHAFLIGNIKFENHQEEIKKVLEDFIYKEKINLNNNSDIYIIENDGKNITKNQIKELLTNLSTTSQKSGIKTYIIPDCEKMSDSVYNALLKTIEEPEEGIIAILTTTNIEKVKDTIRSRCSYIHINDEKEQEENKEITKKLIKTIEENKEKALIKNNEIYTEITDKTLLNSIIKQMLTIYEETLHILINNEKTNEEIKRIIIENNNIEIISEKIILLNKYIEKIEYNLNKNILIDNLIIQLGRCSNETNKSPI